MEYDVVFEKENEESPITDIDKDAATIAGILNLKDLKGLSKEDNRLYTQSIKHYQLDLDTYDNMHELSTQMQTNIKKGMKELPVFDKLYRDMFMSLYKYTPELRLEEKMKASTKINNQIMRKLAETEEFKKLRRFCRLDVFNTVIGTESLGKNAIDIISKLNNDEKREKAKENDATPSLNDLIKEALKAEEKEEKAKKELSEMQGVPYDNSENESMESSENVDNSDGDMDDLSDKDLEGDGEALGNGIYDGTDNSNPKDTSEASGKVFMKFEQAKELADKLNREIEEKLDTSDIVDNFVEQVTESIKVLNETIAKESEFITNWGFGGQSKEAQKIPINDKRKALERIRKSDKLLKISKLIGRFKDTALTDQKRKTKDGAVTIKSVTIGDDIKNVLPSEKMLLINDTTKLNFYKKYNQKELLQYELESNKVKSKGPMIVCIDTSGSMRNEKEVWSKAVAIALLEIANLQKRNFAGLIFSEKVLEPIIIEKNTLDPSKVLDIAETFLGHGTQYEPVLNKALDVIKTSKFKKADVIFLTDGEAAVSDKFLKDLLKIKKEKEFKILGVVINIGSNVNTKTLKEFCDDLVYVSDIKELENDNSDTIHKIFNSV